MSKVNTKAQSLLGSIKNQNGTVGATVKNNIKKIGFRNFDEGTWNLNDEVLWDNVVENEDGSTVELKNAEEREAALAQVLFMTTIGNTPTGGIVAPCGSVSKQLYFSQLRRSVPYYTKNENGDVEVVREANGSAKIFTPNGSCYESLCHTHDASEIFTEMCNHKGVRVASVSDPVTTARYQAGVIIGLRDVRVPVWEWID